MKKSKLATTALIMATLTLALVSFAYAATVTTPDLKVDPADSHIFQLYGNDFNASAPVTITISGANQTYTLVKQPETDEAGAFNMTIIAPTSYNGTYNLTATSKTSAGNANATATIVITVPNLTGPQGTQGAAGVNGTQGPQGETGFTGATGTPGEIPNTDALVVGVALSIIISIGAMVVAWFKKK